MPAATFVIGMLSSGGAVQPEPASVAAPVSGVAADQPEGTDNPPTGDAEAILASTGVAASPPGTAPARAAGAAATAPVLARPVVRPPAAAAPPVASATVFAYKIAAGMMANICHAAVSMIPFGMFDTRLLEKKSSRGLSAAAEASGVAREPAK
jgi:hypothetical protein